LPHVMLMQRLREERLQIHGVNAGFSTQHRRQRAR
jgi:hypothetical protein